MVYSYRAGVLVPFVQKYYKLLILVFATLFVASMAAMSMSASAVMVNGCDFDDTTPGVWSLQGDCTTSAQINIPADTVVEGNGFTVSAGFARTDNDNNSVFGVINSDNVTIQNLTIVGTGGTNLHGINAYLSDNVLVDGVTITDINRTGVVVNGSNVTVNDIRTSSSGWHAINVDQGTGVTDPSVLTVTGNSSHTADELHIYVDNTTENVTVNDNESQYTMSVPVGLPANDALYTLKRTAEITSPDVAEVVSGSVEFAAFLKDDDADNIQWAIRSGTCAAGTGTVFGNVDGNTDVATIDQTDLSNQTFSFTADTTTVNDGSYCFVYNPVEDGGESNIRLTREFVIENFASNKDECKDGGWSDGAFSEQGPVTFRNQGDCVSYFATAGANPATNGATNERANRNR